MPSKTLFKRLGPGVITGAPTTIPAASPPIPRPARSSASACCGRGAHLAADGRRSSRSAPASAASPAAAWPRNMVDGLPAQRRDRAGGAAVRRQHHQYRRRPGRHGRRREAGRWAAASTSTPWPSRRARLLLQVFVPYHRYVALPEVADPVAVRLCRRGLHREASTGRRWPSAPFVPQIELTGRGAHPGRGDLRHHHQPLPLLLAELPGGRGGGGRSRRRAAARSIPSRRRASCSRIGWDTCVGMAISNLIAFFIMLTTAATLHAAGKTDIQTAGAGGRGAEADRRRRSPSSCSASASSAPACWPCRCWPARWPMRSARLRGWHDRPGAAARRGGGLLHR